MTSPSSQTSPPHASPASTSPASTSPAPSPTGIGLAGIDPAGVSAAYDERGIAAWSDATLIEEAARIVARPKADAPDSFILHAPLELLARAALLAHVRPAARTAARQRIVHLAAAFESWGPGVATRTEAANASEGPSDIGTEDLVGALAAAVGAGDLDRAESYGRTLAERLDPRELAARTADVVAPSLAAAAHGSIFLHHLDRVLPRSPLAAAMFGNLARELARNPDWTLTWIDTARTGDGPDSPVGTNVVRALADTPVLGVPGSTFIQPVMHQVDQALAPEVLGGADLGPDTEVAVLRAATASMLADDPDHAPYGWSHCLTMPQAVAGIAPLAVDPAALRAVAATHVVGFRAALGSAPLTELRSRHGRVTTHGLLDDVTAPEPDALARAIDHAATHHDAHLAKYTVACLDAARTDPAGADQHRAALVHLSEWWHAADAG